MLKIKDEPDNSISEMTGKMNVIKKINEISETINY